MSTVHHARRRPSTDGRRPVVRRSPGTLTLGALTLVALAIGGAACGDPTVEPEAAVASTTEPAVTGSTVPTESTESTVPTVPTVQVAKVSDDVAYYGACGNETVDVNGRTWYPLFPEELEALDTRGYPVVASGGFESSGFARVAPPGPGDDIGTFVVYTDGLARYESESGRVIWLTADEHQYNWVC